MFNASQSQISRIQKNKDYIKEEWQKFSNPDRKRKRTGKSGSVEEKLLEWYSQAKKDGLPISGPMLMEKAKGIGQAIGLDFKPTTGWLGRWKDRNGITLKRFKDEKDGSPSISKIASHWRRYTLLKATKEVDPKDVWVMDSTMLFYNALPESLTQPESVNLNNSDMMSVILACNVAGTERRPAIVVSQVQALSNIVLPLSFHHHPEGEISLEFISLVLKDWDKELRHKKRRIVLLLPKTSYYPENLHLFNIHLNFFPPNTEPVLQPFGFGIANTFKALYRYQLIRQVQATMQANNFIMHTQMFNQNVPTLSSIPVSVSPLDAIFMIYKAWKHISSDTLAKGMVKAGLSKDVHVLSTADQVDAPPGLSQQEFEDLINIDDHISSKQQREQNQSSQVCSVPLANTAHFHKQQQQPQQMQQQSTVTYSNHNLMSKNPTSHQTVMIDSLQNPRSVSEALAACRTIRQYLQQQGGRLYDKFSEVEAAIQLDMTLEACPELKHSLRPDPLHDPESLHSLCAQSHLKTQQQPDQASAHKTQLQQQHQQQQQQHQQQQPQQQPQQQLQQQPQQQQQQMHTLKTSHAPVHVTVHSTSPMVVPSHNMGSVTHMRHDIQPHEIHRPNISRQESHVVLPHSDLIRHDLMRPEHTARQDLVQERSRVSMPELRTFATTMVPDGRTDVRVDNKTDLRNVMHSDGRVLGSDVKFMSSDLRTNISGEGRGSVSTGETQHTLPTDMSQSLRPQEIRVENQGLQYYNITSHLHPYVQHK
ncbi:uncharacterized protein LOC143038567 isoform X2 [Oratosquilla oratoria]